MASAAIYHERQSLQRCALHTLNNFFGEPRFTKVHLDGICAELSPDAFVNPHKSVLGLGNYDVEVLRVAFQQQGYACVWFDARKDPERDLNMDAIEGFVLNVREKRFLLPDGHHWFCLRKVDKKWFNLDSKLKQPVELDSPLHAIRELLNLGDTQLFLVCSEASTDQVYLPRVTAETNTAEALSRELSAMPPDAAAGDPKDPLDAAQERLERLSLAPEAED